MITLTDLDIQAISERVIAQLKESSVTIDELSTTNALAADDMLELNKGRKVSLDDLRKFIRGFGIFLEIIAKDDKTTIPSDNNVFSALRTLSEINKSTEELKNIFLRKDQEDKTDFLLRLLGGLVTTDIKSDDFLLGALGTGYGLLKKDSTGKSYFEVDKLFVRLKAIFAELEVMELTYSGGNFIFGPAGARCTKVEEYDEYYRCYFTADDGSKKVKNKFRVDDQVQCRESNIEEGVHENVSNKYYWRLCVGVGDDYIDLSKSVRDMASDDPPQAEDSMVTVGNQKDITRQNVIIISVYGEGSPSITRYQGINSFSMEGKAIKTEYYDATTGRYKEITYGDNYNGAPDRSSFFEYIVGEGLKVKGAVEILPGSVGASNFQDLPEEIYKAVKIGSENLLKNTSFAGDYESLTLTSQTKLNSKTDLYSPRLIGWTGSATVVEDSNAVSGYSVALGSISQNINLIQGEIYVVSYKAKGNSVQIECGTNTIKQQLTSEYKRYSHVFTNNNATSITLSGSASLCDLKLERGTIATDWCPSVQDPDQVKDGFKHLWYLQEALQGSTKFIGGLTLTSMIELGKWTDGVMEKVTAGVSGIYNDDNDVALWSGGTFESAIKVVNMIINGDTPSDEEWKSLAKFIATHGGDIIIRGYIYALGGVFRGIVYAEGGEFNGKITTSKNGQRIEIDPETNTFTMYDDKDHKCLELRWSESTGGLNYSAISLNEYDESGTLIFQTVLSGRLMSMYDKTSSTNIIVQPEQLRVTSQNGIEYSYITKDTISVRNSNGQTTIMPESIMVKGNGVGSKFGLTGSFDYLKSLTYNASGSITGAEKGKIHVLNGIVYNIE